MDAGAALQLPVFNAFLSHGYRAPAVNLFFYGLIEEIVRLTFRVDPPASLDGQRRVKRSTSTTRLERMMRDSDVFVGVWSLPGDPMAAWDAAALATASRYFRLELDMALRAGKPGIVFCDTRFAGMHVRPPMRHISYDAQEITLDNPPSRAAWQAEVRDFVSGLEPRTHLRGGGVENGRVGLVVTPEHADLARDVVQSRSLDLMQLPWPPQLGPGSLGQLRRCDWVIVDVTEPAGQAVLAFLHGRFIPTLRIRSGSEMTAGEKFLAGTLEVGYRRDVTRCDVEEELRDRLGERLDAIADPPRLVGDVASAVAYFRSANLRKEPVFLSYAGENNDLASEFARALSTHFRRIFNYREAESLPAGRPWEDALEAEVKGAAIGVILLSREYQASPHCMEEAMRLFANREQGQVVLLPVKLDGDEAPVLLRKLQYRRISDATPAEIVHRFVAALDRAGPPVP